MLTGHNSCGKQLPITPTISTTGLSIFIWHVFLFLIHNKTFIQIALWWRSRGDFSVLKHTPAGCMTTVGDMLSGNQISDLSITGRSFCCLCFHGRSHLQLLVISVHWAESQSHKVMPRRTELLFSWIYITEPPPKPRGNGKMELPARFNRRPWASWSEGTTKLWHTTAHFVQLLKDTMRLSVPQQACVFHSHYNTFILTSCNNNSITSGGTHWQTSVN